MITELTVSEVIPNSSHNSARCGLKGGNSRWQRKERKQRRKNQRRKRGIEAQRLITILKAFGITTPNFNPGGEFNFPPGFFVATHKPRPRSGASEFSTFPLGNYLAETAESY